MDKQLFLQKQNTTITPMSDKACLLAKMQQQAWIITPNNRLSHQLLAQCLNQSQKLMIDKPTCLPYPAFLQWLFKRIQHIQPNADLPCVLSPLQEYALWQKVIHSDTDTPSSSSLLHAVQEAWTNCQQWNIDFDHPSFQQNQQTQQFRHWQQQFQQELIALNGITTDQLATYLLPFISLFADQEIIWVCFNQFTPQQQALMEAFHNNGGQQYHYDLPMHSIPIQQYPASDEKDEGLQLIHWLQENLSQGKKNIGVVIPELQNQSSLMMRFFSQHLSEENFELSLGTPLSAIPLVDHALCWLQLDKQSISQQQARLLLHSPFLGETKSEFLARSQALQSCLLLQEPLISFPLLLEVFSDMIPKLYGRLQAMSEYPKHAMSPYDWVKCFKQRLHELGFPGEYPLDSEAFQAYQRFLTLWDEWLQLTLIYPSLTQEQALFYVSQLATTTIFQTRKTKAPIQVLGLLEASGCEFECLWVCGVTDHCLPQKTHLSPFIPMDIQRNQSMPKALVDNELAFAKQLLQRLQNGCQEMVLSYPKLVGDIPYLPSPLIQTFQLFEASQITRSFNNQLITEKESYLVPCADHEMITGGTALLANQAKCPFRAFAAHRLHAKPAPEVSLGPDMKERGQVLHRVMESLWQSIGSQQQLLALSDADISQHIQSAISTALEPIIRYRCYSFSPLIQSMEQNRLHQLARACLEWEKQRPHFVIAALEKTFTIELAGIEFNVRVDRLDQVGDYQWVIDYKSSLPASKPWYEERPEEPQLLLYALLDEDINALLFLQLKVGQLTCAGLSADASDIAGIQTVKKDHSWQTIRSQWHEKLNFLATEFRQGYCPPTPSRNTICQQCDYPSLCRKNFKNNASPLGS